MSTNPGPAVTTGATNVMNAEGPNQIGASDSATVAFYGVDPIAQPASAAQAALTIVTATVSGYGFASASGFQQFINQLENIRASLVALGLLKGSA